MIKLQPKIYDHIMLTVRISFIPSGVQNQLGLTSEERLMLANLRVRAAPKNSYYRLDGSDPRESDGELLVLEWESRASKSRVVTPLAGSSIRNGPVSLNPATGLAPGDIRSMVRSLVICLTHASEVRGAAKGFSSSFAEEARFLQELKTSPSEGEETH
uniref:Uncharacterized protein n=1 Tax=Brassica oleracea var. oleracea TaxID=109376 RepID=A0A0D2ZQF6_BRAOL